MGSQTDAIRCSLWGHEKNAIPEVIPETLLLCCVVLWVVKFATHLCHCCVCFQGHNRTVAKALFIFFFAFVLRSCSLPLGLLCVDRQRSLKAKQCFLSHLHTITTTTGRSTPLPPSGKLKPQRLMGTKINNLFFTHRKAFPLSLHDARRNLLWILLPRYLGSERWEKLFCQYIAFSLFLIVCVCRNTSVALIT